MRRSAITAVVVLFTSQSLFGLTIVPTFTDSAGETWDATRIAIVETAIDDWEYVFSNVNETVEVEWDFTNAGGSSYLGQWSGGYSLTYYTEIPTPVRPWDTSTLVGFTGAEVDVTQVIHLNADHFAGPNYIWFDSTPGTDGDLPFEAWDALSIVRHEIGHMLGINDGFYRDNVFDPNTYNWDNQITGTTFDAGGLNLPIAGPTDLAHFANSGPTVDDLMVPALVNGQRRVISANDIAALEVAYGYDLVPEPATLLLFSLAGVAVTRRRRL